jgi:tRNA(Arg) A34 adenosine deaminase TadA
MSRLGLTRRGAMLGGACLFGHSAVAQAANNPDCPVVAAPAHLELSAQVQERHEIYLRLAMALVFDGWGVDRERKDLVAAYAAAEPGRQFGAYAGHNVGALLVGAQDQIICFALNRNVELNSTLEHAEARAIRMAIQIANAERFQSGGPAWSFSNLLRGDRLYATLEPCAQCAGIMDLANVGTVVFGQKDPAQHDIINILYNLRHSPSGQTSSDAGGAPTPVPAAFLDVWGELEAAYRSFVATAQADSRIGLTSFLETVAAYRIYREAAAAFTAMQVRDQANAAALRAAKEFRAQWRGRVFVGTIPD